jgi:hypothetical protein
MWCGIFFHIAQVTRRKMDQVGVTLKKQNLRKIDTIQTIISVALIHMKEFTLLLISELISVALIHMKELTLLLISGLPTKALKVIVGPNNPVTVVHLKNELFSNAQFVVHAFQHVTFKSFWLTQVRSGNNCLISTTFSLKERRPLALLSVA